MLRKFNHWVGKTLSVMFAAVFLAPSAQAAGPGVSNQNQSFPILNKEPGSQKNNLEQKAWTTSDSIAVRYFGFTVGDRGGGTTTPAALFTKDGTHFVVSSFRGELQCECIIQTVDVYQTERVHAWLQDAGSAISPLKTLTMRTQARWTEAPMSYMHWDDSGTRLNFLGRDSSDVSQLFQLELPTGRLRSLTNDSGFKESPQFLGNTVMYLRSLPTTDAMSSDPMVMVPRRRDGEVRVPFMRSSYVTDWVASYKGSPPWVLPLRDELHLLVWGDPSGSRAIIATQDAAGVPQRILLADFANHSIKVLSEVATSAKSPTSSMPIQALWTPDGKQVVLSGIASSPLREPTGKSTPSEASVIGVYSLSGAWETLRTLGRQESTQKRVTSIRWIGTDHALQLKYEVRNGPSELEIFAANTERKWTLKSSGSESAPAVEAESTTARLTVKVLQDANSPPKLMVSDGSVARELSKPDASLANIQIAAQSPFTWSVNGSSQVTGGLTLPPNARSGGPLPLVIEAGRYKPNTFLPDGYVFVGFATQTLAANGIAVLSMNSFDLPGSGTTREAPEFVDRIDAAIEQLANQGIIDTNKVAVVGHSRSGYHTYFAVTHPGKYKLAAASIWDSNTLSFPQYLAHAAISGGIKSDFENANGGLFWGNEQAWLSRDVIFAAKHAEAATLFAVHGQLGQASNEMGNSGLMTIGAFQINKRPFDFIFFPEGAHLLTRVREHARAMEINTDWLRFWLQDYEDSAEAKKERYARWRLIRARNDERKVEEAGVGREISEIMSRRQNKKIYDEESRSLRQKFISEGEKEAIYNANSLEEAAFKALYRDGNPTQALTLFRSGIVLFPQTAAQFYNGIAETQLQMNDAKQAIHSYTVLLHLDPGAEMQANANEIVAWLDADLANIGSFQRQKREQYFRGISR